MSRQSYLIRVLIYDPSKRAGPEYRDGSGVQLERSRGAGMAFKVVEILVNVYKKEFVQLELRICLLANVSRLRQVSCHTLKRH